jgi:hypothetical protein
VRGEGISPVEVLPQGAGVLSRRKKVSSAKTRKAEVKEPSDKPAAAQAKKPEKKFKCSHDVIRITVSVPGLMHKVHRDIELKKASGSKRSQLLDDAIDELVEISR